MTDRRTFLRLAALAALAATGACGRSGSGAEVGPDAELLGDAPADERTRLALRALDRLAYGPRPGDVARVASLGLDAYLESQLAPESLPDPTCERRVRRVEALGLAVEDLYALSDGEALAALRRGTVLRAVYGERQLLERLVQFWSDHFNVYGAKEGCGRLLVEHDRGVIRRHALGRFGDLVAAVTKSPAMLVYLDGAASAAGRPNENHARELLELHTLGVDGGYSERDVREAARALTGWRLRRHWRPGRPAFDAAAHDDEGKEVLGARIEPGLGAADADRLVEITCAHPSTARHLARKLCARFVAEDAPPELVDRVARRFVESDGDIRDTLRALVHSAEFLEARPKLKRPYDYAVSALRALGADTDGGEGLQKALSDLGHLPFAWPTPDGFPDRAARWESGLARRWRFALDLVSGAIEGTTLSDERLGRASAQVAFFRPEDLGPVERALLASAEGPVESAMLSLAGPAFQYH
jgi:uncharacterized protein (DUF1800 family)